jgi:excisionase family DNA binding protein
MCHYTVNETAEKLRLSPAWVRQKIFRRQIRFLKIGRRVFIPDSTIEDILQKSVVEPRNKCEKF